MKLLQLNCTANWGSTGKIAEGIGLAAIESGWTSIIAYGRYANHSKSRLVKCGTKVDVYAHYLNNILFDSEGLGSKYPTKKLINIIEAEEPDIIHLHNIHDHWLNYPTLFKYLSTISTPIVWTFHDCWAFTGHCYYFDESNCKKWKTICNQCPQKGIIDRSNRNFLLKRDLISSIGNRLTIVPVSHWMEKFCKESFFRNNSITMIHNGIDTNIFRPLLKKCVKPLIIGVALPWAKRKGLSDFIELRKKLPIDEFDILLVGLDNNQLKSLPKGILGFTKTQSIEELAGLYSKATVFVNPTYSDNFPTTNIEALSCGTPVITYNTGGSPEAIDDKTGIVIEQGNIDSLAKAIVHVVNNPSAYNSEDCRLRAVVNFNMKNQFSKYIDLYNSLITRS